MGINIIIYLVEMIAIILAILIGLIIFIIKNKDGLLKYLAICLGIYGVIFIATFMLERPDIYIGNLKDIEVNIFSFLKHFIPSAIFLYVPFPLM